MKFIWISLLGFKPRMDEIDVCSACYVVLDVAENCLLCVHTGIGYNTLLSLLSCVNACVGAVYIKALVLFG